MIDPAILEMKTRAWGGKHRNIRTEDVRKALTNKSPTQCLNFLRDIFLIGDIEIGKRQTRLLTK